MQSISIKMPVFFRTIISALLILTTVRATTIREDGLFFPDKQVELLWKSYIPTYMDLFFSSQYLELPLKVSESCENHVKYWIEQILRFKDRPADTETWALHMIDSWGKTPEGILVGHVNSLGAFDECVELRGMDSDQKSSFQGLYCTTYIVQENSGNSSDSMSDVNDYKFGGGVSLGTIEEIMRGRSGSVANCFPSSCTKEDVQTMLSDYFQYSNITTDYDQIPSVSNCVTNQDPYLPAGTIVMITILSGIGLLCVVATVIDVWQKGKVIRESLQHVGLGMQTLLAFSLVKNTKSLLQAAPAQDTLTCLYGIRFLSMAWIVLMHTNSMFTMSTVFNFVDVQLMYKENWSTMAIKNGQVAVDTFFVISGLLVTYNLLKTLEKSNGKFNIGIHYLHRYLRLTPVYAVIVGCLATILPYLSSGPNWNVMNMWSVNCQRSWWHNLLYINNLIDYGDNFQENGICNGLSWYLSVDMQLFVVAPLFVYPLWRWRRLGKAILGLATLVSILTPGFIAYADHLTPLLITARPDSQAVTRALYFAPWSRAGPYLVGVWTGYLLFKTGVGARVKIPLRIVVACWCISTATALAVLFGVSSYFDPKYEISRVEGAMYAGLHRFVWGLVIAWVIVSCVKGYAKWVNGFLSWQLFGPLSKLTFCMYLLSYFIQMVFHLRLRQPLVYDTYTVINLFFAHLLMSILISYLFVVTIEFPFLRLDKLYLGRFTSAPKPPPGPRLVYTPQDQQASSSNNV